MTTRNLINKDGTVHVENQTVGAHHDMLSKKNSRKLPINSMNVQSNIHADDKSVTVQGLNFEVYDSSS